MTRRWFVSAWTCAALLATGRSAGANAASDGLRAKASAHVYNLEHAEALAAFREAVGDEPVLSLDPRRKDAGLFVGTYRYIVATLALPLRMMAYVVGFGGNREKGLHLIEDAANYSGENQTDARFALILLYNREKRYADA